MSVDETELEMVQRHVREGGRHVANQRALIARLSASGRPTEDAEILLAIFEYSQHQHEEHLERLEGRQS